jgi:hypothetical protein
MVYSSSVRGIQQEAKDRCGVEVTGKVGSSLTMKTAFS